MSKDNFLEAEVRQKIIDALKCDLVGPSSEDELMDENPMFEYLTGMLYPQSIANRSMVCEQEIDTDVDRTSNETDYTPQPDEDDNEPMAATKFKQQSSIGLSFYLKKTTIKFNVDIFWGDYIRQSEKKVDEAGKEHIKYLFKRTQQKSTLEITLTDFDKHKEYRLLADSNIQVRASKIGLKNEYMLVTVSLINLRHNGETPVERLMFQSRIEAYGDGDIFIAENICRNVVSVEEFYYAQRPIFGRGRGCAVESVATNFTAASRMITAFIPEYEIPNVKAAIDGFDKDHFWMSFMARPSKKDEIILKLEALTSAYKEWIQAKLVSYPQMSDTDFKKDIGNDVVEKCINSLNRIKAGIEILKVNNVAFDSFCFMNSVMSLQRSILDYSKQHGKGIECAFQDYIDTNKSENHFCWRPFQIAFILMNIKGIVNPTDADREVVDLLYFPTGGGKTEAYLGLIAFVVAHRRLTSKPDDELNKDGGVTVILRYTLRLLTTQQRDRLTKMIIAAEFIRQNDSTKFGREPIALGFWVGGGVTPNKFADLIEDEKDREKSRKNKNLLFKQLLVCPFCGKPLTEDNYKILPDEHSVKIYCSDKDCIFYIYKQNRMSIPVYLVDEEIYSKCPTVILATVDKFANLPWGPKINSLFGRVDRKCSRDGYISLGENHPQKHRAKGDYDSSTLSSIKMFVPPELIIQDELHLITGPLGTIYGAYETLIQDLCKYKIDDKTILPKYVASTATIKNASEQTRCLYGRRDTTQFPASGFEVGDSFFIKEIPLTESPFRKYVGIGAIGQSMKTTTLRVYAVILQTVFTLANEPEYRDLVDPYFTLVGYFNSIRELGGTVRLLQDDIPKRIYRVMRKNGQSKDRKVFQRVEITSRVSSYKISELLKKLEIPYGDIGCLDTAIATNMIAVGMDVDRLGLMTVMGQPKQNSEYIQATSRIGRQHPGVVFSIYNPYRPRDLSHYENFVGYHTQLYRYVEGTTATPFSARARDRVLHALIIAAIRLKYPEFAENENANNIKNLTKEQMDEVVKMIQDRLSIVNPVAKTETQREIELFIDQWKLLTVQKKSLRYYVPNTETCNRLMNYYGEYGDVSEKATLNSMREVETSASLYYFLED